MLNWIMDRMRSAARPNGAQEEQEDEAPTIEDQIHEHIIPLLAGYVKSTHEHGHVTSWLYPSVESRLVKVSHEDISTLNMSRDFSLDYCKRQPTSEAEIVDYIVMDVRFLSKEIDRKTDEPLVDQTYRINVQHVEAEESPGNVAPGPKDINYIEALVPEPWEE